VRRAGVNEGASRSQWGIAAGPLPTRRGTEDNASPLRSGSGRIANYGRVISINTIVAVVGFVVGTGIGAGSLALGTDSVQGRLGRDVMQRPAALALAALYVMACGVGLAVIAFRLAD